MIIIAGILTIFVLVIVFVVIKFNREVKEAVEERPVTSSQTKMIVEATANAQRSLASTALDIGKFMTNLQALEDVRGRGMTMSEYVKVAPKEFREEFKKKGLIYRSHNEFFVRRGLFTQWEK